MRSRRERVLRRSVAAALVRRLPTWNGVLVLGYHRIGDHRRSPYDPDLYSATPEGFGAQLDLLAAAAEIVPPGAVAELSGARGRRVAITFDDGYRDNHEHALPALEARGIPAAFFIPTGFIDRPRIAWWDEIAWMATHATAASVPAGRWLPAPVALADGRAAAASLVAAYKRMPAAEWDPFLDHVADTTGAGRASPAAAADVWMTWDMVRDMRARGMEIGGHTVDHPILARLDREEQQRQIEGCLRRLAEELGERPTLFTYPVGGADAFDRHSRDILAREGVRAAFALAGGHVRLPAADRLALPRAAIHHALSDWQVLARVGYPPRFARW